MGEVWEGLHVPQQIPVAVKILTQRGLRKDSFVEAFRNEVRAAARLDHPGIVTVLDYGEVPAGAAKLSDGLFEAHSPYIVMEFARRGALKRFRDALGWRELRVVLFSVLDALAHAHACGVVHRDLKPGNILVGCGPDHLPGIKLTDFGLAHALDQHEFGGVTDSGWGTPQYMAPEQFRGAWRDYGPWTDLYALGIMAFYLTVGEYPYSGEDSGALARAHQLGSPRDFAPRFEVPEHFEGWVARLIQKAPDDRFACAADAAWALQKIGDPQNQERHRTTMSMLPVGGPNSGGGGEGRSGTADYRTINPDRADTILDRPATTRLIDVDLSADRRNDTLSFSVQHWSEFDAAALEAAPLADFRDAPPLPYTWRRTQSRAPSPKLVGAGLGLFGLRTISMVNREPERDYLWDTLRTVREEGEARAVLIRGPAGTGKSRLGRWLTRRAHEVGSAVVLKAVFSPIAGPGDGLARMVAQHLRAGGLSHAETISRVGRKMKELGVRDDVQVRALAEFILPIGGTDPELETLSMRLQGPNRRYGMIVRLLERLAEHRPVIIWFDDIQWGADALAFTRFVLERQHQQPLPVFFVMTARNEALVNRAVETQQVAELVRNRRMRVLDVDPLDEHHTGELVRELLYLSPSLAEEVERRCDGNPLFAVQLVGDWVAGGKLRFGPEGFEMKRGVDAEIPDDLHSIWRDRLTLLLRRRPSDDRIALEVAAALGMSVELEEWYAACAEYGLPSPTGLFRELLEAGLAISTDYGFEFCHGLFRESLERSARDAGRWTDVNAACVRMLEATYPKREFPFAERFAHHIIAAGDPRRAVGPLLEAARARVDRSEFDFAISLLDEREEVLDDLGIEPIDELRAIGWVTRARVFLWQGRYDEAESFASRAAVESRRHGWNEILARATQAEGLAHFYRGHLDRAQTLFDRAAGEMMGLGDRTGRGQALHGLGRVAQARGQFDEAEELFEQARELMIEVGHRLGEAQCLNALGDVARDRGRWEEALGHSLQAREIFEELDNGIGVADCLNDLAELHRFQGALEEARDLCSEALRRYEAMGSEHSMHVRTNLALTLAESGRIPQARQLLDEVRVRFEQTEQSGPLATVDLLLLPLLAELGEWSLARRRFNQARPLVMQSGIGGRDLQRAVRRAVRLAHDHGKNDFGDALDQFLSSQLL
jgi:serine/threonine protein kinase/tetratricopeptide (TPR) repeat protein